MSIQVGPGISINIHVTSDTDGFAKREYVDQKIQEAERGEIKTVNGAAPDENGNVQVSGLPEGAGAYQQLVTDGDGNAVWEGKTHCYVSDNTTMVPEQTTVSRYNILYSGGLALLAGVIYKVVYDGIEYESEAEWFDKGNNVTRLYYNYATGEKLPFEMTCYGINPNATMESDVVCQIFVRDWDNEYGKTVKVIYNGDGYVMPISKLYLPTTVPVIPATPTSEDAGKVPTVQADGSWALGAIPEGFGGSWNDLTDKPFYESPSTIGELLPETTIEPTKFTIAAALYFYADCQIDGIVAGNEYTVTVDSAEYTVTATSDERTIYIPDYERNIVFEPAALYIEGLGLVYGTTGYGTGFFGAGMATHAYKVQGMVAGEIKPLDEQFIPDSIARTSDIPTNVSAFTNDAGYLTELPTTVPVIPTATVGQTIVVKAVDENGKPTEWEAVGGVRVFNVDGEGNVEPAVLSEEERYVIEDSPYTSTSVLLEDGDAGHTFNCIGIRIPGDGTLRCVFYNPYKNDRMEVVISTSNGTVTLDAGEPS